MSEIFTVEEAIKNNIQLAGTRPKSQFIVSVRTDIRSKKNALLFREIKRLFNKNLNILEYSKNKIKHISFILITLNTGKGVDWKDKKEINANEIRLEIKFPNYQQFVTATKQQALRIMAAEILRGSEKFLKDEKDFDYNKFYSDVEKLFKDNNLL